ncbi:PREDICTED: fat-body protein 1-like, partial [Rhagoletis zephyria]|uniref:fat-body protein 1-like n=1 Tax=Rhagoletis zephyria TaxID=28612 RepID=UPI0008117D68
MYVLPNDEILQEFLNQAGNQEILGRNDIYSPADISNIRQLVGLQRFFVLARDFYVFQKNVVYARLYFNAVIFVDALSLAIRDRPDTQDLVMPPMNEILPQLYYDNYVLNSAQNVDYRNLIYQATRTNAKASLFDYFGLGKISSLLEGGKYGLFNPLQQRRIQVAYDPQDIVIASSNQRVNYRESHPDYFGDRNEIPVEIALPVGEQNGLATDLTNDIDLNVALKNVIIDQLTQTVTEAIEGGQQIGDIGKYQQYHQQGQYYKQGPYYQKGQYHQQGPYYNKGPYYQQGQYYKQGSYHQQGVYNKQGPYYKQESYYQQGPYYQQESHYKQEPYHRKGQYYQQEDRQTGRYSNANEEASRVRRDQQSIYDEESYSQYLERQEGSPKQSVVNTNELPKVDASSERLLGVGRRHRVNAANSGYSYNVYPFYRQQNQYGNNDREYGSSLYGRQQNQDAEYDYYEQKYGSSYPYGHERKQENQYGYSNQEYPYGRYQKQGAQYGYNDQKYGSSYSINQGAQYGNKDQKYGSSYLCGGRKHQGHQYGYGTQSQQQTYPYDQQNVANVEEMIMNNDDENVV